MNPRVCCHCGAQVGPKASACSFCRKLLIVNSKYGLRRQIGRGGFGIVFEGVVIGAGTRCAIKLVQATTPPQQRQIETEIGILQKNAKGLPFVPYIYGAWKHEAIIYIVMEFIDGQTLDPSGWPSGYWHYERVRRFLAVMLKQLEQLHAREIIHRDLNPNNIMRTLDKQYKLLDFGIAKPGAQTQTIVRGVGTLAYSPVEQLRAQPTVPCSDLYSLGVVAYHLLVGDVPPDAMQRLGGKLVVRPEAKVANVPPEIDRTIMALIGLEPYERPQSAADALAILNSRVAVPPARRRPAPNLDRARVAGQFNAGPRAAAPVLSPPAPPDLSQLPRRPIPPPLPAQQSEGSGGVGGFLFALLIIGGLLWFFAGSGTANPTTMPVRETASFLASFGNGKIAFSSRRGDAYHLFVVSSDMITPTAVTSGDRNDYAPVWSANGRMLAFVGSTSSNDDIYRVNSDGSDVRNLTNDPAVEGTPVWSPDGLRIAFESNRSGNYDLYLMDADGGNVEPFTLNPGIDRSPIWLESNEIIFVSQRGNGWGVYRVSASGGIPAPIFTSTQEIRFPTLSADRQRLAFAMEHAGNWDIYTLAMDGGDPARLTDDPAEDTYPCWSPDGQAIVFMSTRDAGADDLRRAQLYSMRGDGSEQRPVLEDDFDNRHPAWAASQ